MVRLCHNWAKCRNRFKISSYFLRWISLLWQNACLKYETKWNYDYESIEKDVDHKATSIA